MTPTTTERTSLKSRRVRHARSDLDWSVQRTPGWKLWHWRIVKDRYHSLVVPAKWAELEDLFDAKAAELGDTKQTKTAGDIARRVGSGDNRMKFNQVAQLAVLTGRGPSSFTEDEQRFFAAIKGQYVRRAYKAGTLSACCLKLSEDLEDWAAEDSTRVVHPRTPDKIFKVLSNILARNDPKDWFSKQENPEFHRQEIVKHEECLDAIDKRKIQDKEYVGTW
ncbi:hypothetical protein FFLO_00274 [Filobasidium floriforme]|uniref:Uncharacterized protein n=1 Tax=Filobasidium floriforme TaxID=5210 RepID=A0A8K0JS81_9TREE|nr:uncharacterized protein HD553DRAFT_313806 [Filobasidium floriforme]KAG7575455.1 hypothetical protein FFLO_00274 [Filobasidium floriforme]KAH8082592.1 hypothetical protein HD553DRAFT_313806 [Filobasidium floriforme]